LGAGGDIGTNSELITSEAVPQFNPALGVLDSVDVILNAGYLSTVTASGPSGASGEFHVTGSMTLQDPGNYIYVSSLVGTWNGDFLLPSKPGTSGNEAPGQWFPSSSDPACLSEFTGDGNVNLLFTMSQEVYGFSVPPGVTLSITGGRFTVEDSVTYNYTVPEPSCVSLVVIGFGLMLARRKSRNPVPAKAA
jgi:hypothetical protein